MYNSINDNNNSENDREVDLEELCDEIDALMDLMLVDGELSDGTKVWRTTGKSGRTITVSEQRRALMLPQELREMPFEKMIIMMRGRKPIFASPLDNLPSLPIR